MLIFCLSWPGVFCHFALLVFLKLVLVLCYLCCWVVFHWMDAPVWVFIHLSKNNLPVSSFWKLWVQCVNICMQALCEHVFKSHRYLWVWLLEPRVRLCLAQWDTRKLLSKCSVPFCTYIPNKRGSGTLHFCQQLILSVFWFVAITRCTVMTLFEFAFPKWQMIFIILSYVHLSSLSTLIKCLFRCFSSHFKNAVISYFWVLGFLSMFCIQVLYQIYFANTLSQWLFILFTICQ